MNFLIYGVNNPVIVSAIYCATRLSCIEAFGDLKAVNNGRSL